MKKQYLALAGVAAITIVVIILVSKIARAQETAATSRARDSAAPAATAPITFYHEASTNNTPYSATFPGFVVSGRVDVTIGTMKQGNGHTFTGMIVGVRSNEGTYRRGMGVSHFSLRADAVIPSDLVKDKQPGNN